MSRLPILFGRSKSKLKYELVGFDYQNENTSEAWDRKTYAPNLISRNDDNFVEGVLLVELLDSGKLKIEVFPGKTASQVSDFTRSASIYER